MLVQTFQCRVGSGHGSSAGFTLEGWDTTLNTIFNVITILALVVSNLNLCFFPQKIMEV